MKAPPTTPPETYSLKINPLTELKPENYSGSLTDLIRRVAQILGHQQFATDSKQLPLAVQRVGGTHVLFRSHFFPLTICTLQLGETGPSG